MQKINGFWYCLPYGVYESAYLKQLEAQVIYMTPQYAQQRLWRETNFSWETCTAWVQWLGDIHPDLPIAQVKLT